MTSIEQVKREQEKDAEIADLAEALRAARVEIDRLRDELMKLWHQIEHMAISIDRCHAMHGANSLCDYEKH